MKIVLVLLSLVASVHASAAVRQGREVKSTALVQLYDKLVAVDSRLASGEIAHADVCSGEANMKLGISSIDEIRKVKNVAFRATTFEASQRTDGFTSKTFRVLELLHGKQSLQAVTEHLEYAIANEYNPQGVLYTYDVLRTVPDSLLNTVIQDDESVESVILVDSNTREVMIISNWFGGTNDCD